jgi:hypothetical protein
MFYLQNINVHRRTRQFWPRESGKILVDVVAWKHVRRNTQTCRIPCFGIQGKPNYSTTTLTARYSIKTGFGISEEAYTSTEDQPTHGPGQGSRQASALWMIISCLLFSAMYEHCHGVSFCDPSNQITHRKTSDGFVDNVTHFFNLGLTFIMLQNFVSTEDITSGLEREGQSWERFLWTSDGKLELSKCLFYILTYKFEPEGTPQMESATNIPERLVCLTLGEAIERTPIKHYDHKEAHRTLGLWPTLTGDQKLRQEL